jgi:hypothetical protein
MAAIQMRITFQFISDSDPEQVFDSVTEGLFDLEAASETLLDADVTSSLSENTISLSIVGTGETIEAASENASSAIRAAIHKSGGATPGWDQTVEIARHQAVFKFLEQTAVLA